MRAGTANAVTADDMQRETTGSERDRAAEGPDRDELGRQEAAEPLQEGQEPDQNEP